MRKPILIISAIVFTVTGCASVPEINSSFRRIDRLWQLETQKIEDAFRHRVIDADYSVVFPQVKKTFLDLGMPVQKSSVSEGLILAENEAPHPLTMEEWAQVVKVEGPRVKEIGGWMFNLSANPKGYIVTVAAGLKAVRDKTFVLLDYRLDMPDYRRMGFTTSEHAPPLAVQIGAMKFWTQLDKNLKKVGAPSLRKRRADEIHPSVVDQQEYWEVPSRVLAVAVLPVDRTRTK
jgi:hypothetical protein